MVPPVWPSATWRLRLPIRARWRFENGDIIDIDIEARSVNVELTDEQLDERRRELEAGDGYVAHRNRHVSQALKAYATFARSADKGATRDPELINKLSGLN